MPSLGGLISGVFGGAAQAYGEGAQMEMKKQSELDLRKQLLEAESDKRLREDEIKRGRDIAEEARKMSPEYIAQTTAADLARGEGALTNRTLLAPKAVPADVAEAKAKAQVRETVAPINAAADVIEGKTKAETAVALAPSQAGVAKAQFEAEKELRGLKVTEATADQITKAKTLVADKGYMDALEKTDLAAHAHLIKIANIRATSLEGISEDRLEAARLAALRKGPGGGGSTTPTTADLQRQVTAAENALAAKLAVKKTDLNYELGNLQKRTDPASKARLEKATGEIAALDAARKRLTDWSKTPAAEAPAAPAPALPPLKPGMFDTKK